MPPGEKDEADPRRVILRRIVIEADALAKRQLLFTFQSSWKNHSVLVKR